MAIQYAGGTNVNATFTNDGTKANIQSNVITQLTAAGWSLATGPSGGGAQTVTISIASPGVVSLANHGLLANDQVVFSTTGALPTGLTAGTRYFVKSVLSSGTFTVSATAGGAVINTSGTQSGTQTAVCTVRMATAATPWGVTARINLSDYGGTSMGFTIENSTSTLVGASGSNNGGYLFPTNSRVFRVVANKYQAFIFTAPATPARGFVAFGTPYLPTPLQGVLTECGWMQTNAGAGDSDTTIRACLRTGFKSFIGQFQGIANGSLLDLAGSGTSGVGNLNVPMATGQPLATGQTGLHWHDGSAHMLEPLLAWATSSLNGEPFIRGQLWDAVLIFGSWTGDTTTSFDSHNWICLTDTDSTDMCSLFLVTP